MSDALMLVKTLWYGLLVGAYPQMVFILFCSISGANIPLQVQFAISSIAGVAFVLYHAPPLNGWVVLIVCAIAYVGAWLINCFFDWIAPVMPNGKR